MNLLSIENGTHSLRVLHRYPRLRDDVSLHLSHSYSLVLHGDPPVSAYESAAVVQVLSQCDGTKTFDIILSRYLREEKTPSAILETMATLSCYLQKGVLQLEVAPRPQKLRITGSRNVCYPTNIQVELTTACNLRCHYCYRDAGTSPEKRLPTSRLLEILDDLSRKGLLSVELTGGEPFLHPDFSRIIRFCSERFQLIGLLTNGTCINESIIQEMLPFRRKLVIGVSLDSHIAAEHDRRRGLAGAHARTVEGLRLLGHYGFVTRASMSVDENNWSAIEETLLLSRRTGATMFSYAPILPFGRATSVFKFWDLDPKEVAATQLRLMEKYKGFLHLIPEDMMIKVQQPGGCGAGHRVYAMNPEGKLRPCVMFDEKRTWFGSFAEQDPVEIFARQLTHSFATIEAPHPQICGSCQWALFCQQCMLRGLMASRWIGEKNCRWLNQPHVRQWHSQLPQEGDVTR